MNKKKRITIAGIGGVGGYFGGLLAKHFYGSEEAQINFLVRGDHLLEIKKNGLKVIDGVNEFLARPALATDQPSEIGISDYVIISTKSYDLEQVIRQLLPCIGKDTIILPLLNGVDIRERIKNLLPDTLVLDSCVYIVSRLLQPGVIKNSGAIQTLYFGLEEVEDPRLILLEDLLKQAGIKVALIKEISKVVWEKFVFISPTATATSFFNCSIGELLADEERCSTLKALIREVELLARSKGIKVSQTIAEETIKKLQALPFETTSSMHTDFMNKKANTELASLTGYVVNAAQKMNVEVPVYNKTHEQFLKRHI